MAATIGAALVFVGNMRGETLVPTIMGLAAMALTATLCSKLVKIDNAVNMTVEKKPGASDAGTLVAFDTANFASPFWAVFSGMVVALNVNHAVAGAGTGVFYTDPFVAFCVPVNFAHFVCNARGVMRCHMIREGHWNVKHGREVKQKEPKRVRVPKATSIPAFAPAKPRA